MRSSISDQVTLKLVDSQGEDVYIIYDRYPVHPGESNLSWNGLQFSDTLVPQGDYTLVLLSEDGAEQLESTLRIGEPYPLLTNISQNTTVLETNGTLQVAFTASEPGTLHIDLENLSGQKKTALAFLSVPAGEGVYEWDGQSGGQPVENGAYSLILTLYAANKTASINHSLYIELQTQPLATPQPISTESTTSLSPAPSPTGSAMDATPAAGTYQEDPEPTPTAPPALSPPYSSHRDGSFWSMTPGEISDEVIWDILVQPITVYDGGLKAAPKTHAYMMENPDGTGREIAQLHAQSQGLHVIGEPNEYGYVLVEAFSNYDEAYNPKTEEEIEDAFALKQGYVLAEHLKTVEVDPHIGLVIDKLTQRMYLFIDGVRVTEFLIATGKISEGKIYNETIPGEYITISHTGGFWSGNMYCDMAIRINGGILIHEVPYKSNADGTKNYASFEAYLGTKQSHGCVRVQRLKNPEGYNHQWLWENLDRKGGHKVIIWDDLNRYDSPTVWQDNP